MTESVVLVAIMLTGVASALGRLVSPWLSDKIGRKNVVVLLFALMLIAVLCLIFAQSYLYALLIALVAFVFGGTAGVFPAITADYFGTKHIGINYGLIMIAFATSALTFPTVATAVNSGGLPTPLTFLIPAVACAVGIVIALRLKPPVGKEGN